MTDRTRALTLWQPWASLIALGVKRIETRSSSTRYRGPLLIHAAARRPADWTGGEWWTGGIADRDETPFLWGPIGDSGCDVIAKCDGHAPYEHGRTLPLGAVVAVADLVDVVPMIERGDYPPREGGWLTVGPSLLTYRGHCGGDVSDQRPYGDFAAGRFAWLLDNVRPLASPVPATGRQRLWRPSPGLVAEVLKQVAA